MDLAVVDALARLALHERRHGRVLRLGEVPPDLRGLLDLAGLAEVLGVEPGREPEEGEEGVRVEEEGELADPAA
jgi:hypothetical protein